MIPYAAILASLFLHNDLPMTKEEREQKRREATEQETARIAIKRANSPEVGE